MSSPTKNLPVRVLKIWFDIVLVLGGVATVLLSGWLAVSPFWMAEGNRPADATVQAVVGERSWFPVYPLQYEPEDRGRDLGIERASLVQARGEIRLLTTSWPLHFTSVGEIVLGTVIVLYVIWLLRKVLVNVLDDRPFAVANGRYLRRSGYVVLVLGAVWPIVDYALSAYVLSRIDVRNIALRPAITLDKDVFVVGLLLLVFGAILTRGHELQEHEQALEEEQAWTV
jgi:hypothetical protein